MEMQLMDIRSNPYSAHWLFNDWGVDPKNAVEVRKLVRQLHRQSRVWRKCGSGFWQAQGHKLLSDAKDMLTYAQELRRLNRRLTPSR
jgi:regulation of enolase protein 1 (concanavalin A-like superfamily)